MPVVSYDKKDLLKLIGKKLRDEKLEEVINSIKPEVEEISESEVRVEHYADRPDLFGIEGLARAIRFYLGIEKARDYRVSKPRVEVKVKKVPIRPFIACAIIRNIKLTDELIRSLMNIQEVLHETIGRKRKKVAIGVHDFDRIRPPITYTLASKSEKMVPLGYSKEMTLKEILAKTQKGKEFAHLVKESIKLPVYRDRSGIFSLPPILNSERTRVRENTKNLFIEVTGIDKKSVNQTLNILVTNLVERKCKVEGVWVKYGRRKEITPNLKGEKFEIDEEVVKKVLGIEIRKREIVKLLEKMGHKPIKGKKLRVIIPSYRVDILHPIDLVEDIAIAYGLNNFSPELPNVFTIGKAHPIEEFGEKIRKLMIGFGFTEVMRPVLTSMRNQFDLMEIERKGAIEVQNPVSEEYTCLRTWLLPSLMQVLAANKHVEYPQRIFEIGEVVVQAVDEEVGSKTKMKLAGAIAHSKASFSEVKSIVESLLRNLGVKYEIREISPPYFIEGRVGEIIVNKEKIGEFGEINPKVLTNWELEMPVASFEIDLDRLFNSFYI